ncbi:carboxyl transferase domain-containing protein [Sorangium sp. So ce448]
MVGRRGRRRPPPLDKEQGGLITQGAKLLYVFAGATVPEATVIPRKACGGAYDVMASKHIRVDYNLAFPTAELAIMGPEGAVSIVYRCEIQQAADPAAARARFVGDDKAKFANPYKAAELGFIDEVIFYPRMLRTRLARALDLLRDRRDKNPPKKHGNIPL